MPVQRSFISSLHKLLLLLISKLQVKTQARKLKKHLDMNPKAIAFFVFSLLPLLFSSARAQDRAPHGLAYENPLAFSPAAADFFHPKTQPSTKNLCAGTSGCSPLPLAARVDYTQAEESFLSTPQKGGRGVGAGGIAGIVLGSTFVVLLAMGGFYVYLTRRGNSNRSDFVKPDSSA